MAEKKQTEFKGGWKAKKNPVQVFASHLAKLFMLFFSAIFPSHKKTPTEQFSIT